MQSFNNNSHLVLPNLQKEKKNNKKKNEKKKITLINEYSFNCTHILYFIYLNNQ